MGPAYDAIQSCVEKKLKPEVEWCFEYFDSAALQRVIDEQAAIIKIMKEEVKKQGLWAPHLGPEDGGQGMGQLNLGLIHEILGRHSLAPEIFGCQGPDSGNTELLAVGANEAQRERWLYPLMRGEVRSTFSMRSRLASWT